GQMRRPQVFMRREFISGLAGTIAAPLVARAQQDHQMRRIAWLMVYSDADPRNKALREGLEQIGWVDGKTARRDVRVAAEGADQFTTLAKELIALQPDVIIAPSTGVAAAFHRETNTIPIVFIAVSDPIGSGFVASLARPGGNMTGLLNFEATIVGK